ncbi:MAG TPA: hypothetical protein ENG09_02030 [Candidatus Syntrophoarchaeum butanivorans]|uniref:Molecular chaperone TorD n=1 Tax=Candidatus Syntropharchaeum butanivorans TaxID=1839936 RepID=A0A7C1B640_9EURY|nr:hypothetical protein [Candidatus Syntrophoarchaeum butanivorans]
MLAVLEIRRRMYWALTLFFGGEPPRELAEAFVSGRLAFPQVDPDHYPDLARGFLELRRFISGKADAAMLHKELIADYEKVLAPDTGCAPPRCESDWIADEMPDSELLKLESIYRVAGYEPRGEKVTMFRDDIAVELDFMHHLCMRSIEDRENLQKYVEEEILFLREHLLRWVPDFCDELIRRCNSRFYQAVARITKGFLLMDIEIAEKILSGEII